MDKREIYRKVSSTKGKGVDIKRSLCFYDPKDVYNALTTNSEVVRWLKFISNHYLPPSDKKIMLVYPCSNKKPYHKSRSYKILSKTLEALGDKNKYVHLVTISEPFGLVPEEYYEKKTRWHDWKNEWYDCPGLFEWWCNKYNQNFSKEYLDKCIEILAIHIANFFKKADSRNCYSKIVAFVRTYTSQLKEKDDHTHRRIIERAAQIAKVSVEILPDKKLVSKIVKESGRMAWDMYGVAHPLAQGYLLEYLKGVLNEKWYTKLKRLFSGLLN